MKSVSWILLIYFSLGSLFPGNDFGQLGRMANLVKHYQIHQEMESGLSFLGFVAMHLMDKPKHDHKDGQHHQKLPFQQLHSISSFMPIEHHIEFTTLRRSVHVVNFFYRSMIANPHIDQLLQPPI